MANRKTRRRTAAPTPAPALKPLAARSSAELAMLPLGALMFAASVNAFAQNADAAPETVMKPVVVKEKAEQQEGKQTVRASTTTIGKGQQELRDIPQSVTVVTEKLIDDRRIDTVKEALKQTAGITFLAAEGGEEDIRLRGFPLNSTGDLFIDGMRDPAFYDRDTFNLERLEVLRGSASMLFGRGSTGGAVNQVNKMPRLNDDKQLDVTLGSHHYRRFVADANFQTGEESALRVSAMKTDADNNGAGSSIDKGGFAAAYRWGIGTRDEFTVSGYYLDNNNGMNYGMPWIRPSATADVSRTRMLPLDPDAYYGAASDYNHSSAAHATLNHVHRFSSQTELKTQVRLGRYERDQRAGAIRLCTQRTDANTGVVTNPECPTAVTLENFGDDTILTRGTHLKIQDVNTLHAQSDLTSKFEAWGLKHQVLAGVDVAREKKWVYGARNAAQGGVDLTKPKTTVGSDNDGAWVDEASRVLRTTSAFESTGWGVYGQDMVEVAPGWKVVGGLRYDAMKGEYETYAIPSGAAGPTTTEGYEQSIYKWSHRVGLLYQPTALHSFHFSYGTSFNTSGDTYSYSAATVNTPPEESQNLEIGAKIDSADKRWSTRFAIFKSTKLNERNTDPDLNIAVLSGKRHASGAEVDFTGYITPRLEVYGSYMWMPDAKIDKGAEGAEGEGTRPSLTPKHSGTVWATYQFTDKFRAGGGLNFRSKQSPNRNPGWYAEGYVTGDLMAEYVVDPDRLTVKANLTNVSDKLYADALYSGHYIPGAGRQFMLTTEIKF